MLLITEIKLEGDIVDKIGQATGGTLTPEVIGQHAENNRNEPDPSRRTWFMTAGDNRMWAIVREGDLEKAIEGILHLGWA